MLDIVASYYWMQFQGKILNQTWENDKKPSFGTNFGHFGWNLGPRNFNHIFYLHYKLELVASYHCKQFQEKLMNQTWENSKKPSFRADFGPFDLNLGQFFPPKIWLRQSLDIMVCYIIMYNIRKKLMILSWENFEKDGQTDGREWFHKTLPN